MLKKVALLTAATLFGVTALFFLAATLVGFAEEGLGGAMLIPMAFGLGTGSLVHSALTTARRLRSRPTPT